MRQLFAGRGDFDIHAGEMGEVGERQEYAGKREVRRKENVGEVEGFDVGREKTDASEIRRMCGDNGFFRRRESDFRKVWEDAKEGDRREIRWINDSGPNERV